MITHNMKYFYCDSTTSHMIEHMQDEHHIDKNGSIAFKQPLLSFSSAIKSSGSLITPLDPDKFRILLIKWIICQHISFRQVESKQFRNLITYCSPVLESILPQSSDTIRNWVLKEFHKYQKNLTDSFSSFTGPVYISFDLWTSSNSLSLIGVVAHWIDNFHIIRTCLLGLQQIKGQHSGENLAEVISQIFNSFQINKNLAFFILDNASVNDTCMVKLSEEFSFS